MRRIVVLVAVIVLAGAAPALAAPRPAGGTAPGAPGADALWTPADKDGFGTSTTTQSKVWHTLDNGELTEVYYPDLGTPAVRDTQLVVSDGKTFAVKETDSTTQRIELADPRSLTYRQVNTDKAGRFRITKTYVTDPGRNALLVDVTFESLTGKALQLYVLHDPALSNNGNDDSGATSGSALVVHDAAAGGALAASPAFTRTSSGYLGTSDGWEDLRGDYRMDWAYTSAPSGNVVQTGQTALTGLPGSQHLTLALGFGGDAAAALSAANGALGGGFAAAQTAYAGGWHAYLGSLARAGADVTYDVSAMTLAASEDKTFRGAYVASPSMPWVWGQGLERPSGAYHLVWSRDLYEIATALLSDGDRAGADRALTFLLDVQQKPDGSFPQNSEVSGAPHWTNLQMDEVAFPLVLAWQLGRADATTYRDHLKKAADFIVANGPVTPQERWENQGGYSPATIAAEIAGLVCAADLARRNGDTASATRYLATADDWQKRVEGWTATQNGPYSPRPYYLRLTKDGKPNSGTTYDIGDSGPAGVDQRAVVDPSYLELVRLGVKPASDPAIRNTISVVDSHLGVSTPNGTFWHRYTSDGYGEKADGSNWDIGFPAGSQTTIGRIWPIFAGERGEYELAAGSGSPAGRLA
ncbi:MAG: glucoamylase, partial [Solirubrobacteraceae bacterium]|nr:glucoamylase [Solirubrobacteraceae bacterium]